MRRSARTYCGRLWKPLVCACLAAMLLIPAGALAEGTWLTLTDGVLADGENTASQFTGDVRITFLGDCTLGGEEKYKNSRLGYWKRIEENGYDYPFRELIRLTGTDDLTVANLEGVLSDRKLKKVKKTYNFIGPAAFAEILTSGSIECVTLANNHTHDYGEEGYSDTKRALESAGVCWFGADAPAVWESGKGLSIGFLGVSHSLTGDRWRRYQEQTEILKDMGCAAVITVMHTGTEYSAWAPNGYQRQVAERAAAAGSCLIIGHHPHVVQGWDDVQGVPVVYSLGNCSFGGTTYAKDPDALAVQAVLSFETGALSKIALRFFPISITSDGHYNNYAPCFLYGKDAERVLKKMKRSTGRDPGPWNDQEGGTVTFGF